MNTSQNSMQEPTCNHPNQQQDPQNTYIQQVSCQMLDSLIQRVPKEKMASLFYKVVKQEQENTPEVDRFLMVITDVFREIEPNNELLHKRLKSLTQQSHKDVTEQAREDYIKTLSTSEAMVQANCTRQKLSSMVKGNAIVGYKVKGNKSISYPAWQFVGKDVVPGLNTVLQELGFNGEEAATALIRAIKSEGGLSIAQLLHMGDLDGAVRAARFERRFRELTTKDAVIGGNALFDATSDELRSVYKPGRTETP